MGDHPDYAPVLRPSDEAQVRRACDLFYQALPDAYRPFFDAMAAQHHITVAQLVARVWEARVAAFITEDERTLSPEDRAFRTAQGVVQQRHAVAVAQEDARHARAAEVLAAQKDAFDHDRSGTKPDYAIAEDGTVTFFTQTVIGKPFPRPRHRP